MANLVYINPGTPIDWTDDTTGGDYTLDLGALAADAVRAGDIGDLGANSRSGWYAWKLIIDGFDTVPVVGEAVDLYLAGSDNTNHDGDLSGSDADSSTVVLLNLRYLGSATVQTTTAANELIVSGYVFIPSRYVIPVVHNNTADALLSTSDAHHFILTPIPDEIQ